MNNMYFRGKSVKGEMIYGDLQFGINGTPLISCFEITPPTMSDPCGDTIRVYYEVDPATIGQVSPLKDIEGNYVYDGDIVKVNGFYEDALADFETNYIGIVRIDLQRGLMLQNATSGYKQPVFSRSIDIQQYPKGIEVIGNIFDNPEMVNYETI